MSRYPNKPQALVDYAGILGLAHLYEAGRLIASSLRRPREGSGGMDEALFLRVPGPACCEPGSHELKAGGYTLTVISAAGLSPRAVKERLDNCMRLLRALANAPSTFIPPEGGDGGDGPASAELRLWAPSARTRGRN
jgi:hypothetical protein